jgi:hypothetical protein
MLKAMEPATTMGTVFSIDRAMRESGVRSSGLRRVPKALVDPTPSAVAVSGSGRTELTSFMG